MIGAGSVAQKDGNNCIGTTGPADLFHLKGVLDNNGINGTLRIERHNNPLSYMLIDDNEIDAAVNRRLNLNLNSSGNISLVGGGGDVGIGATNPGTWRLNVNGSFTATSKSFEIDHPTKPNMTLVHGSLEGPELAVYYRGRGKLVNGQAKVELPEYFDALTSDNTATVLLTAKGKTPFVLSYDDFDEKSFVAYASVEEGEFDWEVKAVRADVEPLQVERDKKQAQQTPIYEGN